MRRRTNNFGIQTSLSNKNVVIMLSLALLITTTAANPTAVLAEERPNLAKQKVIVPESISGVVTVTAESVVERLTADNPPLLIDARIREDRNFGYIESSISLPDVETNCSTLNNISEDKDAELMFYCNGVQCGRSVVAIKVALSCGYKNLYWFKGGFAEWKEKDYQYLKN